MPPLEGIYQLFCTIDFTFYIKMFSRISVALARTNAVTLDDLIQVIRGAYNPTPITCSVENIYDVKTWLRQDREQQKLGWKYLCQSGNDI